MTPVIEGEGWKFERAVKVVWFRRYETISAGRAVRLDGVCGYWVPLLQIRRIFCKFLFQVLRMSKVDAVKVERAV